MKPSLAPSGMKNFMISTLKTQGYEAMLPHLDQMSDEELTSDRAYKELKKQGVNKALGIMSLVGVKLSDADLKDVCEHIVNKLKAEKEKRCATKTCQT